ncbi:endomucin [Orycteropus afer afer]|uniref:Endomucin n=1 Tax=Orycteropus afer afer TaxID=1230840 RepID=A0A8B7AHU1_ORYAF|nr:endomucin [Orycteropus afer afer]
MTITEKISSHMWYSCSLLYFWRRDETKSVKNTSRDVESTTNHTSSTAILITKTSVLTPSTTLLANSVTESTVGTSPKGTTNREMSKSSLVSTLSSLTTAVKSTGATTSDVMKNESITTTATVTNTALPNTAPTLPSSQPKTENQSSIKATERPVNTLQPEASLSKSTFPSISRSENILQSQVIGTESGKNASSSSTSPSYSSIILPVVIALIVITLSVFVLVGLYRMCRKTDPGTPENGNDQPQSDKESVKLLTVKTISHESGFSSDSMSQDRKGESPVESPSFFTSLHQLPVPIK